MTTYTPAIPTNDDDVIDSRDVIYWIDTLTAQGENEPLSVEDADTLAVLSALQEEAEGSPDWQYGETLIRDSYFRDYAEQLAEDIGAIDRNASWPLNHIDWEAAADALKEDYFSVEFGDVTYWVQG